MRGHPPRRGKPLEGLPGIAQRSPFRTGELERSWSAEPVAGGSAITSSAEHAWPIESGTRFGVRAHRMVADTIAAEESELLKGFEEHVRELSKRAGFEVRG